MNKNIFLFIAVLSLLISQPSFLFSETTKGFQGEISMIDLNAETFQVASGDSAAEKEKGVNLIVMPDTQFKGASALSEFRIGDEVSVEAQLNEETQLWEARSIALVKVKIGETAI
ncbi:MAG: hypothetical protein HY585_01005 [Candidatus Omnitrophica bacterium]|nr:hypothetical protein [Candidatus Omnitrophota bacterium]